MGNMLTILWVLIFDMFEEVANGPDGCGHLWDLNGDAGVVLSISC